jgi:hypothetical protein
MNKILNDIHNLQKDNLEMKKRLEENDKKLDIFIESINKKLNLDKNK